MCLKVYGCNKWAVPCQLPHCLWWVIDVQINVDGCNKWAVPCHIVFDGCIVCEVSFVLKVWWVSLISHVIHGIERESRPKYVFASEVSTVYALLNNTGHLGLTNFYLPLGHGQTWCIWILHIGFLLMVNILAKIGCYSSFKDSSMYSSGKCQRLLRPC